MAVFPNSYETQLRPTKGMHGEKFTADLPGYNNSERINRTNNRFNVSAHDTLNQKYFLDKRLKPLFTYGFAFGYNSMVIPKGRIVAIDPYLDTVDFTTDNAFNTLTLANGGAAVKLRSADDKYGAASPLVSAEAAGQQAGLEGKEWTPLVGLDVAYSDDIPCYNALTTSSAAQLAAKDYVIDSKTGYVATESDGNVSVDLTVRAGNIPVGMIGRNEYTRFQEQDALDGMTPGPIITDSIVELPFFAFKDKAEANPWGSIYGQIKVGDLLKSDENGRLTVSPLSIDAALEKMTLAQIERERQQVVGQCVNLSHDMIPEGGNRWVTWALSDRLKYEGFNPTRYRQNFRDGEDVINSSAYGSTGRYPGYPVEEAYKEHDLHMVSGGSLDGLYDPFISIADQLEWGIPGLTDGFNAVVREYTNKKAAYIRHRGDTPEYVKCFIKINPTGNLEPNATQIRIYNDNGSDFAYTNVVKDALLADGAFKVAFFNAIQGMLVLEVADKDKADALLETNPIMIDIKYKKRGMAGVPTYMDWDGCVGSAKILMQR
jgi:hypothetical protein